MTRPSLELMRRLLAADLADAQGEAEIQAVLLGALVVARLVGQMAGR